MLPATSPSMLPRRFASDTPEPPDEPELERPRQPTFDPSPTPAKPSKRPTDPVVPQQDDGDRMAKGVANGLADVAMRTLAGQGVHVPASAHPALIAAFRTFLGSRA